MSEIINKFNIFRNFPPNLIQNIKAFYVARNHSSGLGYCVLNDNKVYGFGEIIHEILDYNKSEAKYVLINELNDKNILEFYEGLRFMFARNDKNEIFSWGENGRFEQLARGYQTRVYSRPKKINFFNGKNIINISFGTSHCLALSSDGRVYGWGNNEEGQIGCGEREEDIISTPIEIGLIEKIKLIHCTSDRSFAVSFDGDLYYWGEIGWYEIYEPIKLNSSIKIQSILNTTTDAIFFISYDCVIYELSEEKEMGLKIFCDFNKGMEGKKIIDLCSEDNAVIFQTEDCVYVYKNSKVEKTSYKTLFEYFLFEFQKTLKTIHIKENQLFVWDFENNEENLIEKYKKIYLNENSFKQNDTNLSLRNFRISCDLPQILESNVKYYYQSSSYSSDSYFGLFVMNDNRVYCFGDNFNGKLGLGYNDRVYEYTEIIELKDKNIQQFYQGVECMFAQNNENKIFSWGWNFYGQLARGYKSEEYLRPEKIDIFDDKSIIEISCGSSHCLALSSDGKVYGWGYNKYESVGCGERETSYISTRIEIDFNEKIQFIQCGRDLSFGVSFDGNPYYWGKIHELDKINIPKLISMKNVFKIYYYSLEMCIILDKNGKVFKFYYKNEEIIDIKSEVNFCDLYSKENYCLLQSEECVYQLNYSGLIKTDIINFFDFYSNKSQYYKKTIEISKDGYLMEKQIHFNEREKNLVLRDKYVFERKYENNFEEVTQKGKGGFGTVYEVKKKSNNVHYAIKRIEIQNELNLSEIKIMCELNNDFVVQYIDSWIERQLIFRKIQRYLLIQMELCSNNLRDFIEIMNDSFNEKFLHFYYFISCELFKELIECVNYLHSLNPPIIHRDLKPENILISKGINGRFLKLCDFGLAKIHEESNHTRDIGTRKYMAPEVRDSENYNIKTDIYSLALIATEIFRFEDKVINIRKHKNPEDFDKYLSKYLNSILENHFKELLETLSKCLLQENYHLRPDCKQLLQCIKVVTIDNDFILNNEKLREFKSSLDNSKKLILRMFFDTKIMQTFENQKFIFNYSDSQNYCIDTIISTVNAENPQPNYYNESDFNQAFECVRIQFDKLTNLSDIPSIDYKISRDYANKLTSKIIELKPLIFNESMETMVDKREYLHFIKFNIEFQNFRCISVSKDESCLCTAVSHSLIGAKHLKYVLRLLTVLENIKYYKKYKTTKYLEKLNKQNGETFKLGFIEELKSYLNPKVENDSTAMVYIMSGVLERPIFLYGRYPDGRAQAFYYSIDCYGKEPVCLLSENSKQFRCLLPTIENITNNTRLSVFGRPSDEDQSEELEIILQSCPPRRLVNDSDNMCKIDDF